MQCFFYQAKIGVLPAFDKSGKKRLRFLGDKRSIGLENMNRKKFK